MRFFGLRHEALRVSLKGPAQAMHPTPLFIVVLHSDLRKKHPQGCDEYTLGVRVNLGFRINVPGFRV